MFCIMKKILWTTVFWLVVFFGFVFYVKMFDANMAAGVSTYLGATISTSGELITSGAQSEIMSGIVNLQTSLTDVQTKLDMLVGGTTPITTANSLTGTSTSSKTSTTSTKETVKTLETVQPKAN